MKDHPADAKLRRPEETDRLNKIDTFIAQNPRARAIDVAAAIGCTEAEALSAMSGEAWEIPTEALPEVLAELRTWGRVMVLVRNADAVAEVEVPSDSWYVNGDWLNWIDEDYNLHLRVVATDQILALVRPGKRGPTHSFNLVNRSGRVFCRFYTRTPAASKRFLDFCRAHSDK